MPNSIAYIALYSWPLIVFILFRKLPPSTALAWSIVAGYLFLPTRTGFNLPMFPTIDKYALPSLAAAFMCFFALNAEAKPVRRMNSAGPRAPRSVARQRPEAGRQTAPGSTSGKKLISGLVVLLLTSPILTVFLNGDPVIAGPRFIRGLKLYDGLSMIGNQVFAIVPFLLAWRFLATPQSHVMLLKVLCLAGMGYSLLALYEVRMSPQLNVNLYGFFPHSFLQHIRGAGFRPIVFMHHGLWLGIFFAMTILAAAALRRDKATLHKRLHWLFCAFWLLIVLFLSKSLGALIIALFLLQAVLFLGVRGQLICASALALIVLLYPMVRGAGLVPTDQIYTAAQSISEERAASLNYRLRNEDALLERANERPLSGWGSWGRNQIYDPDTGHVLSTTDGVWIIVIGTLGWLGYIARFGLLTIPIILLAFRSPRRNLSLATSGLALVLTANLVDLIPNATLTPLTWLVSGALMGRYTFKQKDQAMPDATQTAQQMIRSEPPKFVRTKRTTRVQSAPSLGTGRDPDPRTTR